MLDKGGNIIPESRAFFFQVAECVGEAIVIADRQGKVIYANPAALGTLGYAKHELIGFSFHERIHRFVPGKSDHSEDCLLCKAAQSSDVQVIGEAVFYQKKGRAIPVQYKMRSFYQEGQNAGVIVSFTDISDRKTLQYHLSEQVEVLDKVFNTVPFVMMVIDDTLRVEKVNYAGEQFFGKKDDEIRGALGGQVISCFSSFKDKGCGLEEECRSCPFRGTVEETFRIGENIVKQEVQLDIFLGGVRSKRSLMISTGILQIDQVKKVLLTVDDITQERQFEQQLRENELRFRTLFDAVQTGILLIERESRRIVEVNRVAQEIFGMPAEKMVGRHCSQFICPAEKDCCPVIDLGQKVDNSERELIRYDGSKIPVLKTVSSIRLQEKEYLLECFVDISELKKLEADLLAAKNEAETANKAKSRFLANMSHEIRTPMNAVLGYAQLIERDGSLAPSLKEMVKTIIGSGNHLLGLLNDILEMSKIEAGQTELAVTAVDFHGLLADIDRMFRLRAENKGLSLTFAYVNHVPRYLMADQMKLRQILINLIGNAVKFTLRGGIKVQVKAMGEQGGKTLFSVLVEDTGCGISQEEQKNVFNYFEQTESGRNYGGTGLGMAISQGFSRLMGGDIRLLYSRENGGSVFQFDFWAEVIENEKTDDGPVLYIDGLHPDFVGLSVLVVDDTRTNRKLLADMLERLGFVISEAISGEEALRLARKEKFDLVLMDYQMPGLNGLETTFQIREMEGYQNIPVIMVTANALLEDQEKIQKAGILYLRKPFKREELLEQIRQSTQVEYIYRQEGGGKDGYDHLAVALLTEDLRKQLLKMVEMGDMEGFGALLPRVRAVHHGLADRLKKMADRYEYEELSTLLES